MLLSDIDYFKEEEEEKEVSSFLSEGFYHHTSYHSFIHKYIIHTSTYTYVKTIRIRFGVLKIELLHFMKWPQKTGNEMKLK